MEVDLLPDPEERVRILAATGSHQGERRTDWFAKGVLKHHRTLATTLNTLIAVSIGGIVPLLLKRFGQDPAVASGPLLTTVTDMAGFFLVLSLATVFMPYLT